MKFLTKSALSIKLLTLIFIGTTASMSARAADREDVVIGVVAGAAVGYALSRHSDRVQISYRYPRHYHHHQRCNQPHYYPGHHGHADRFERSDHRSHYYNPGHHPHGHHRNSEYRGSRYQNSFRGHDKPSKARMPGGSAQHSLPRRY